jgi:hypothetical protein
MLPEDTRGNQGFQFSTPAMAAERAASELRYGRPVIVKGPKFCSRHWRSTPIPPPPMSSLQWLRGDVTHFF